VRRPGATAPTRRQRPAICLEEKCVSGEFDAVIDFDKATRDPSNPKRFLPAYDVGDHLHPSDAGYEAMAEAVDLSGLECRR
jgi:lysophospholipase L1-like esterase